MDYEYYYNQAKRRYNNACSEITNCQNKTNELKTQKQQKINQINQIKTDLKNNQEAFDEMSKVIKSDEVLNAKLTGITNKTNEATINYSGMVSSSNIVIKILNEVYRDESTKTKSTLSSILESLKTKKNALDTKITELQKQLSTAETELQNIETKIKTTETSLGDWKKTKSSASIDMEYYRKKMNQAV